MSILNTNKQYKNKQNKKATPRFELGDKSFAGSCLTTWPCRHLVTL